MLNKCKLMFLSLIIVICFSSCCCDFFDNDNKKSTHINVTEEYKEIIKVDVCSKYETQYNIKIINDKELAKKAYISEIKSDNIDVKSVCIKYNKGNKWKKINFKNDKNHLLAIVAITKDLGNIDENLGNIDEDPNKYLVYIPECYINSDQGPFLDNQNVTYVKILSVGEGIKKLESLFKGCRNLTEIDLSKLDTSKVINMSGMFEYCSSLTEIKFPKEGFGSACENMTYMFIYCGCSNINLSSFDTSNVKNMSSMFRGCKGLTKITLPAGFGSACENMSDMFSECEGLTEINLSKFDTKKVTDMFLMFSGCKNLKKIDLSNLNTSKVTDMFYMFSGCEGLEEIIFPKEKFGLACENISYMFEGCKNLKEIDLSNFYTLKVKNMYGMFSKCSTLTEIKFSAGFGSACKNTSNMFSGCVNLSDDTKDKIKKLNLPLYN